MQTTVRKPTLKENLIAVARQQLPVLRSIGERYCLITPAGGSPQARAVAAYMSQSDDYTVFRIAILPAGDGSPYASGDEDSAWAVVDHRTRSILFGPEEGIQVSVPDIGLGAYTFGQLIRLLRTKSDLNSYRVVEIAFPRKPEDEGQDAWVRKVSKATAVLENHGFHVSESSTGLVANAQKFGSLSERWNSDKINFLPSARLVSLYNESVTDLAEVRGSINEREMHAQSLEQEVVRLQALAQDADELRRQVHTLQQSVDKLTGQAALVAPLQEEVAQAREVLEEAQEALSTQPAPAVSTAAVPPSQVPVSAEHHHEHRLGRFERVVLLVLAVAIAGGALLPALGS